MFMVDLVQWWYAKGWGVFFVGIKNRIADTADAFSIGELARTFFKPYRQIGMAENANQPKISAFFDRLISRLVGMISRAVLMMAGIILIVLEAVIAGMLLLIWPIIPLLPVFGIILTVMGVAI